MISPKMIRRFIALGVVALSGCASFNPPINVQDIAFSDPNFAQCISQQSSMQLDQITSIQCNEANITAVDEIKYMPNLAVLILLDNEIDEIDTSHNPKLDRLILSRNKISQLDLSKNPKLVALNITSNNLAELDVSYNSELESLYAYKMPLANIDVSKQPKLRHLGLSKHKLTSIDLSANPELIQLNLAVGELRSLDVSHNPKLAFLTLPGNQLTALDLSRNSQLKTVNVRNNKLTEIELGEHPKLQKFKADYNQLSVLDFTLAGDLTALELNNNHLSKLDLSHNSKLKKLTAFNNPLHTLTLNDADALTLFSVEGTPYALANAEQANKRNISNTESPIVSIIEGGVITKNGAKYDVAASQLVTPEIGQYLGFRYSVTAPKESKKHQFPITVRMTHPEIIDPNTGKGFTVSSWTDTMFKHNRNLAMWYFGGKEEMVSGRWTLEILYRNEVVAKRAFKLVNMDDPNELLKMQQSLQVKQLFKDSEKVLCEQEKYRSCFGFESASSCVASLTPYKQRCQFDAIDKMKKSGSNATGKAALQQYFGQFAVCVGTLHIQNNNLDPESIGQCLAK